MVDTVQDLMVFVMVVTAVILAIMLLLRIFTAGLELTAAVLNAAARVKDALSPRQPAAQSGFPQFHASFQAIPGIVYHGTKSLPAAVSIIYDGWQVGLTKHIWVTSGFETAKAYGDFIVAIHVAPYAGLTHVGNDVYTAPVPHAEEDTFYRIHGLTPRCVLSAQTGRQIYPLT
jgi:hypothetical protein